MTIRRILVTGGAGFVGSHLVERLAEAHPEALVVVLDKMTYAADENHIAHVLDARRAELHVGDARDRGLVRDLMQDVDFVVHAAAESHVDRSFADPLGFVDNNVLGTQVVMQAALEARVPRVIHVSTDEVYGSVAEGAADEATRFDPTNPYAASKAAAEMVVNGMRHSFGLPVVVVRANNMFGTRQFPEKLIPHCITAMLDGGKIRLHGDGSAVRHYLSARDFADGVVLLAERGQVGRAYNVGAYHAYSNLEVAHMVASHFGRRAADVIEFVPDRPHQDMRYAVDWLAMAGLGWKPTRTLAAELPGIARWYAENADPIRARVARVFWDKIEQRHASRLAALPAARAAM